MACEYVREYYGVQACIGRRITYKKREGVIAADRGNYIGVNFDDCKPNVILNFHPKTEGLEYGEMGEVRKMTRSQKKYQAYLDSEISCTFAEYLGIRI
jgi:hypothetical protein